MYETEKVEKTFINNADSYGSDIEQELNYDVSVVVSLQAFFKAGGIPSREAFKMFVSQLLENHKQIKALSWLPRIPEAERDGYVHEARKYFPHFQILDLKNQGEMVPSSPRSVYYPAYYIEPYQGNEKELGFDYFSNEERRKLLEQLRDTGESLSTEPILLMQEKENQHAYLIYAPIYKGKNPSLTLHDRRQNIVGFVVGTFKFQHLINSFNTIETNNLNVTLYGVDPIKGKRFLYSTDKNIKENRKPGGLSHEYSIKVAEETWTLIFTPKPGEYKVKISLQDWTLLGIPMLLIILTSIYMWFILRYSEENSQLASKFTTLLEASPNAQLLLDNQNIIILVNKKSEQLLGYSRSDLIHQPYSKILTKASREKISTIRIPKPRDNKKLKLFVLRKDGLEIPVEFEISPLIQAEKEVLFVCTLIDLREIKSLEKNLENVAHYDQLTKLPNQQYLKKILRKKLIASKKNNQFLYLFFIGLDQFKTLNSSLGSMVGDGILRSIADRIRELTSAENFAARIGGSEFILISTKPKNREEAQLLAHQILRIFIRPMQIAKNKIKTTVSIGISCYPKDGKDRETLIKNAALTMNHVKNEGGNAYEFFYSGMDVDYQYKFELETALDFALERKEFYLEYQPITGVRSQKIIGTEALIRWNHPKLGLISPAEFIPFIENKPLMNDIGEWVFKTACLQGKAWNKKFKGLYMSINVSPRQLQDKSYFRNLIHFCEEKHISPHTIILEITESMVMQAHKKSEDILKELAKDGFSISIDDFGTKYSSLERLSTLPISYLKIDKSFVDRIGKNESTEQIIKSILTLAENLKMKVIAEGVETKEQLDFLIAHKCLYIQGFYFSKPLSPRGISTLLQKQTTHPASFPRPRLR